MESIKISAQAEIDKLQLEHKYEIERIKTEHTHQIEKIELEYKHQKDNKSNDMSSEMAMKFFNGELDLEYILSNINNLQNLQNIVQKSKSKKHTSNFIKKQ